MSKARYFQDELDYLRKSGDEFSQYFPRLTEYLSSRSVDPDVERLLEGFAFLTGRLREKVDDQLPEVTQSLLMLLWPNFLRPIPSMTIIELAPVPGSISEAQVIEKNSEIESIPIDGTICRFKTAYDAVIHPLCVKDLRHDVSREASVITLRLETLSQEDIKTINLESLRFYLGGGDYSALMINLWLHRYTKNCLLCTPSGKEIAFSADKIRPVGLSKGEGVLPYPDNAFTGYRLVQEFFCLPQKYYFFDIVDLPLHAVENGADHIDLVITFKRPLPPDVRVRSASFMLHCVPAINLFDHDSEPILLDGKRTEYQLLPSRRNAGALEIFSVEKVVGWTANPDAPSGGISREYSRFESFAHEIERVDGRTTIYFRERVVQSISTEHLERMLSFVREDEVAQVNVGETISVDMLCSNGVIPAELGIGDVAIPSNTLPSFVRPRNVIRPTVPRYPVVDGTLQWQLISALSLNYLSLENAEALRTILHSFDFASRVDRKNERTAQRRLEGIESIHSETIDRLFKGIPVRGMRSTIKMRESHFASEGEMFLFSTVLAEFFALFSTINSFHELVVHGMEAGEEYRWPVRVGNQPLI